MCMKRFNGFTVVPESIISARAVLGQAMRAGDARTIERAYASLENADRMARLRRTVVHTNRVIIRVLGR